MTAVHTEGLQREPAYDLRALLPGTLYCMDCAGRLCERVSRIPGVLDAACAVEDGALGVVFDPAIVTQAELDEAVARVARDTAGEVGHAAYRLTGLD